MRIHYRHLPVIAILVGSLVACSGSRVASENKNPARRPEIVLLTGEGCTNSPAMQENLNGALVILGWPRKYKVVDAGTLPTSDGKRQFGTPTVLVDGKDLMGSRKPTPGRAEPG